MSSVDTSTLSVNQLELLKRVLFFARPKQHLQAFEFIVSDNIDLNKNILFIEFPVNASMDTCTLAFPVYTPLFKAIKAAEKVLSHPVGPNNKHLRGEYLGSYIFINSIQFVSDSAVLLNLGCE